MRIKFNDELQVERDMVHNHAIIWDVFRNEKRIGWVTLYPLSKSFHINGQIEVYFTKLNDDEFIDFLFAMTNLQ